MRDQGGTGFVGLNDYLGANQDPLNAQFAADSTKAHGVGDSLMGMLGDVSADAMSATHGAGAPIHPDTLASFNTAQAAAQQAGNLGTKFGSPTTVGATPFDSALQWGAHGADYRNLSGYLNGLTDLPQSNFDLGTGQAGPQTQPGARNRGPRTPIDHPGEHQPEPAPPTPWIDPDHTDPNGGPAYIDPWRGSGGGG